MNRNITAVILIVLAIGIYVTYTRDKWTEVQAVQSVNKQYSTAISNADHLLIVREKVLKDFNNLTLDQKDRLDKMVPNTVDNIRLLIDLNNVALRRGFTLKNIKASAGAPTNSGAQRTAPTANVTTIGHAPTIIPAPILDSVTISFSLTAPYQQFISFMQDLEANLRVMDVTQLKVGGNDTGTYDYNVEMKTYWLRQP